MTLESSQFRW